MVYWLYNRKIITERLGREVIVYMGSGKWSRGTTLERKDPGTSYKIQVLVSMTH